MTRRLLATVGLLTALLIVGSPAAADPAGPTNFRSTVTGIVPADGLQGVEVDVLGGDAFLVLRVPPGTEVQVPGYEGEPYLRFATDGTVEVNTRSPARWLNDARFGAAEVEVPLQADAAAPPTWEQVATDGEYAWHDHRIHWMSPALPPAVDATAGAAQPVNDWAIPLAVDGRDVEVGGELVWLPGPPVAVPVGAVLVALALGVIVVMRWPSRLPWVVAVGAVMTVAVGLVVSVGLPAGADVEPALVVLPALSLAVLVAAGVWSRRDPARAGWFTAAAALPVGVWAVIQAGALTRPIVPGPLPVELVRGVTALAFGVAAAALVAVVKRGLALTALDRD